MAEFINLIKLSVGTENLEDLAAWHQNPRAQSADGHPQHVTRMWPKRSDELLNGGSIYWIIKGVIQARQRILRLDERIGADGIRRCALVLERPLIRVAPALRRPFQGWRYLPMTEAPPDLKPGQAAEEPLPAELQSALSEIGIL